MIDKNKQYKTRSGLPVRIYATDGGGDYPVHGGLPCGEHWIMTCWTNEGKSVSHSQPELDLIEVKPRIQLTEWFNIYRTGTQGGYRSRELADTYADTARVACLEITIDCEEGEGL